MKISTTAVKGAESGIVPDEASFPIHLSTICSQKIPGTVEGFEYGRLENPTRSKVEKELAMLEGAATAVLFSSGSAAITAVFSLLKSGDHVICGREVYEGTRRIIEKIFAKFGIEATFVRDESEIEPAIRSSTRLVWFETVSNPLLSVVDIQKIKSRLHGRDILLAIDSTFTTSFCIKPLELGADLVIHSATKFLGGHHDLIGGAVLTNDALLAEQVRFIQQTTGSMLDPFECFLLGRSLKTFALRMEKQCNNAIELAKFFSSHPCIKEVRFPGLESHPQHMVAKEQMKAFGAMISVRLKGTNIDRFFEHLEIVKVSQSLGGFGTMIQVPAKMMQLSNPKEELGELGIDEKLLRISVGLEDIDDLIAEFVGALEAIT